MLPVRLAIASAFQASFAEFIQCQLGMKRFNELVRFRSGLGVARWINEGWGIACWLGARLPRQRAECFFDQCRNLGRMLGHGNFGSFEGGHFANGCAKVTVEF